MLTFAPKNSQVTLASSATARSDVPAVHIAIFPFFSDFPYSSISVLAISLNSISGISFFKSSYWCLLALVPKTEVFLSLKSLKIPTSVSSVFPWQKITSPNPLLCSLWKSIFAKSISL